jgi:DNA adenine methylase
VSCTAPARRGINKDTLTKKVIRIAGNTVELYSKPISKRPLVRADADGALARPFLKWAGGKQWLARTARSLLPSSFSGTFFEPFLGGGSFFFALEPKQAVLADVNSDLIETYDAVKNDVEGIIRLLGSYPHDKSFYYALRTKVPRTARTNAARFIYLNRTCWNGLYRVNRKGEFNVPFGQRANPTICDRPRLRSAAKKLANTRLVCGDFCDVVRAAQRGDLVYLDPPYITGHTNNGFLKYNARLFCWEDQKRLRDTAFELADRGVNVLISNADHPTISRMYARFHRYTVDRNSLIGGKGSVRGPISELLIASYQLFES